MQSSKPGCALFNKTKLGQLTTAINVVFFKRKGGGEGKEKGGGRGEPVHGFVSCVRRNPNIAIPHTTSEVLYTKDSKMMRLYSIDFSALSCFPGTSSENYNADI